MSIGLHLLMLWQEGRTRFTNLLPDVLEADLKKKLSPAPNSVKGVQQVGKHLTYNVEVSKDDFIHSLRFNEDGDLIEEESERAFLPDAHEGPTFEDIPE